MKSDLVQEELHRHSPDVGDALVNDKRKGGGIRAADSPHGGLSIRRPKFYVGCLPKSEEQNKDAARGVGVAVEGPTATVTPC
ncbi:hypothetical protein BESB_035080 [Besnoitia besnoiti]|uniref:Uncharacterized protein n=1 Tax=Besnoitia besnoiti TaxID=94643 RepID=A0A2A9MN34_BESBE|nr:hypothetical protein BESB_035080 [Besnoitia besnoiti]PFH37050.1 hypothetical protein BESB_035080 [Besnoitia besnoiti]